MRILFSIVLGCVAAGLLPVSTQQPAERACPKCVRIFDGQTWAGWEHDPANWTIVDGAMRGFGPGARSAFTQADYGNFRLLYTVK